MSTSSKHYAHSTFVKSAVISGLVNDAQIRDALQAICASNEYDARRPDDVTDRDLMKCLVATGKLTSYQAEQLRVGRTKLSLGSYLITDWIGQGGMGQVFKAEHKVMGRVCAIKVLPLSKSTETAIENFLREIRTQARLDHPHLVRAYDAGKDGNVHYLVVEYVPGTDLRRLVRSRGKLPMHHAASIIKQAADGLEYAHAQGLIHRDVKPGNIMVTPDGVSKVSDLGLAGFMADIDRDPRHGRIVGTADYLSPEQIRNPKEITKASDIYSLGCTLYYAITGKVPFPGGSAKNKARRHLEETPWHPRRFNEDVSDEFVDLIADMMEKDPANRIKSAGEVSQRLEPWVKDASPIASPQIGSRWMPAPPPSSKEDDELGMSHDTDSALGLGELVTSELANIGHSSQALVSTVTLQDTSGSTDSLPPPPPLVYDFGGRGGNKKDMVRLKRAILIGIPAAFVLGVIVGLFGAFLFL